MVGVGTWLGGEWGRRFTQPEVDRLLGRARELGVNLVDTAECYGDHLAEALGVRRTRPSRCRAAACSSWPARLSSRLEAGTAGSSQPCDQPVNNHMGEPFDLGVDGWDRLVGELFGGTGEGAHALINSW